jgi:hypothetical protein
LEQAGKEATEAFEVSVVVAISLERKNAGVETSIIIFDPFY